MNKYNYPDNDYRSYLEHGTKGLHWKWPFHKYLYIDKNNNYVYPKDLVPNAKRKASRAIKGAKNTISNIAADITNGSVLNKVKTGASRTSQKVKTSVASLRPKNISRNFYKSTGYDKINLKNVSSSVKSSLKESNERRKQQKIDRRNRKQQQKTDAAKKKTAKKGYDKYLNSRKGLSGLVNKIRNRKIKNSSINKERRTYRETGLNKHGSYLDFLSAVGGFSKRDLEIRLTRANKAKKRRYKTEKFEKKVAAFDAEEREFQKRKSDAKKILNGNAIKNGYMKVVSNISIERGEPLDKASYENVTIYNQSIMDKLLKKSKHNTKANSQGAS